MRISNARLKWQEDGLPWSEQFDDVYFSRQGALAESRHVFIEANELWSRWQQAEQALQEDSPASPFVIAELGFGCAVNFLQTLKLWQQFRQANPDARLRLHYLGFEKHPPHKDDLKRILSLWPELAPASEEFLRLYPDHSAGCHRLFLNHCQLDLRYGDASDSLEEIARHGLARVDAWFVDGFSPGKNPAMWHEQLFKLLSACSKSGCTLSSYSVAGAVRRALAAAGFELNKAPGYGNKRHMLKAVLRSPTRLPRREQSWLQLPRYAASEADTVCVIGAGLAGCSVAHSLARRGLKVTLLDAASDAMTAASGIGPLALRCRLVAEDNASARFYLQAYLHSVRHFSSLPGQQDFWHQCGLLQLDEAMADRLQRHGDQLREKLLALYEPAVIENLDREDASKLAGLELSSGGLFFPAGGWIEPKGLANALLSHPDIEFRGNSEVAALRNQDRQWLILDPNGRELGRSSALVITTSAAMKQWTACADLPVEQVRGQLTHIASTPRSEALKTVVCAARSLFPASGGSHCLAATYQRHDANLQCRPIDDASNLQLARQALREPELLDSEIVASRSAIRSSTPDRLPLLGAVPDLPAMLERFADLQQDASLQFEQAGAYHPGLYVSAAHGSNGLSSCSLGGEYLASLICGETPPLDDSIMAALNPVRFLIRDLKKQKSPRLTQR